MFDAAKFATRDPVLTGFSTGYSDQDLSGALIMPVTRVGTNSGRYLVFDRSAWMIFPDVRAQGTVANEIAGGKWAEDTFSVVEHSLQARVDDEEREEMAAASSVDTPTLNLEQEAVGICTRSILLGHEKAVADLIRNTATYPAGHTVTLTAGASGTQWNEYASTNSDPVANIRAALDKVFRATRRKANTMVLSYDAFTQIPNHPKVVNRFVNFALTEGDVDAFRKLTGFTGTVIIPESGYNAADNIDATENFTDLWGQDVWVGIVDSTPGQKTKTFGKTFARPYGADLRPTDRWREEPRKSDLFRVSYRYDLKVVSNNAGYLIKNAVAVPT